jgi:maspardin
MRNAAFDSIFQAVEPEQKEQLLQFRATHPHKHLLVARVDWEYISCGQGKDVMLLLPGGTQLADAFFMIIPDFEEEYRIIVPSYPSAPSMAPLLEGIAAILEAEGIQKVHIIGPSFGGWVAQCFVRRYPDKVATMILNDTSFPRRRRALAGILSLPLLFVLPSRLVFAFLKRELTSLMPALPEKERVFWLAYFQEVLSRSTKEDVLRLWKCAIDLHQHYRFTSNDLVLWPGKVLILDSDDDPAVAASIRAVLKTLYPGAQSHTFHQAGHSPFLTRRTEYLSIVRSFLAKATSGTSQEVSL